MLISWCRKHLDTIGPVSRFILIFGLSCAFEEIVSMLVYSYYKTDMSLQESPNFLSNSRFTYAEPTPQKQFIRFLILESQTPNAHTRIEEAVQQIYNKINAETITRSQSSLKALIETSLYLIQDGIVRFIPIDQDAFFSPQQLSASNGGVVLGTIRYEQLVYAAVWFSNKKPM